MTGLDDSGDRSGTSIDCSSGGPVSGVASTNGRRPVRVWSIVAGFVIIFALAVAAVLFRGPCLVPARGTPTTAWSGLVAVLVVDTFQRR